MAESTAEILVASAEHVGDAVLVVEDAKQRRVRKYGRFYSLKFSPEEIPMRKGSNRVQLTITGLSKLEAAKLEMADGVGPAVNPRDSLKREYRSLGRVKRADGAVVKRFVRPSPPNYQHNGVSDITIPAGAVNSNGQYDITLDISIQHPALGSSAQVGITGRSLQSGKINKGSRRVCVDQFHPHHVAHVEPMLSLDHAATGER